jgi:hypothetical protein
VVLRSIHVARAVGVEVAEPRDLKIPPDGAQVGRRRDGIVADVVAFELPRGAVAQDHVGCAVAVKIAEASELKLNPTVPKAAAFVMLLLAMS